MAAGGRLSFRLNTPVGVFCLASALRFFTSSLVHGSRERCLYFGFALRGPVLPIGEPGRFHAGCAMMSSTRDTGTTCETNPCSTRSLSRQTVQRFSAEKMRPMTCLSAERFIPAVEQQ